jgi:hypothetical protein
LRAVSGLSSTILFSQDRMARDVVPAGACRALKKIAEPHGFAVFSPQSI